MTGQLGSQMKSRLEFDIACGRASIAWGPIGPTGRRAQLCVRASRRALIKDTDCRATVERKGERAGHAKNYVVTAVRGERIL